MNRRAFLATLTAAAMAAACRLYGVAEEEPVVTLPDQVPVADGWREAGFRVGEWVHIPIPGPPAPVGFCRIKSITTTTITLG